MISQHFENIANYTGQEISSLDDIEILENGNQIFPSIIESIKLAKKYILFETFIYWDGEISNQISEALIERSQAGVKCYLLFDGYGCKNLSKKTIKKMKKNGVHISYYNPFRFINLFKTNSINRRTHRKIIAIDGIIGFIGGVGIADRWKGDASSPSEWRDLHFKISGHILNQLQRAFLDNWLEYPNTKIDPTALKFSPSHTNQESIKSNIVISTPLQKYNALRTQLLESIRLAKNSIKIITPYFIPDEVEIDELIKASNRGIEVEIILPGEHVDMKISKYSSRYFWGELLKNNVNIYEYSPTFNHSKVIIIDNFWVTVGSLNVDARSLKLNEEANLNIFNMDFANKMSLIFEKDKNKSEKVEYSKWKNRDLRTKILDYFASLFRSFI